ncbi:membrane protein insertion efficiency factor YidD [Leeuwenhoekiella marinoflava]|uniref:membrane protein insertion efficiency factor YidD n=1 Tax=Leeuwenhoekiella marinoflava TaxID=988 RepID=UPI0030034F5A
MRIFLLLLIRFYWISIPKTNRRRCLFKKSCSHYVFDIAKDEGLLSGLKALNFRYKHCRPGYFILKDEGVLISSESKSFDRSQIRDNLFSN